MTSYPFEIPLEGRGLPISITGVVSDLGREAALGEKPFSPSYLKDVSVGGRSVTDSALLDCAWRAFVKDVQEGYRSCTANL